MAELHKDGFDHYATAAHAIEKWGGVGLATGLSIGAYGRNGTQGLRISAGGVSQITGYLQYTVANLATSGFAMALRGTGTDRQVVRWMDNATEQVSIKLRSDGRLEATGPWGTTVGTAVISSSVHRWVTAKLTIHNSTGRIQVYVDSIAAADIDTGGGGVDTQTTANAYATAFRVGYGPAAPETQSYIYDIDDFVLFDTTGGVVPNDVFADARIECLFPTGAGGSTQFTPSAGSNYQNVDETAPNDDTDYNSSSTVGHLDRFAMGNLSASTATIHNVTVWARVRKEDAGARTVHLHHYLSTAGTPTQESGDLLPLTAYSWLKSTQSVDGDAAAWSVTKVNALEAGVEIQA